MSIYYLLLTVQFMFICKFFKIVFYLIFFNITADNI